MKLLGSGNMKKNKIIIGVIIIILIISLSIILMNRKQTDNIKFSKEYEITENNIFVYKDINQIIKILENGTGILYLGFPECPWCKAYVKYLNETALENNLDKIYYFNILEDRKDNTEEYQKIVSILQDYLRYDDEGNKRIYVPAVISIKNGVITGFDDETSYDTKNYDSPEEYWKNEDIDSLKEKLTKMIESTIDNTCTDCNK